MLTFALAIPHTPWVPERVSSLDRLKSSLGNRPIHYREFTDREPNWSWSGKLWQWGYETGATHLLQLQDDVIVGPDFWPSLRTMIESGVSGPIGLESVMSIGSTWYTSSDCMIGVGYCLPHAFIGQLLDWRQSELRPGAIQRLNEDQLIGLFCFVNRIPIWHPTTTIIDHDVEIGSTYGNDHHSHRRPARSTVRGDVGAWDVRGDVPHVKRFYASTPSLARQYVLGYSYERYLEDCR